MTSSTPSRHPSLALYLLFCAPNWIGCGPKQCPQPLSPPPPEIRVVEKKVPCMSPLLATSLPDDRNWTFVDAVGAPVAPGATPIRAILPMSEVGHIFELVAYLNQQLDACHAAGRPN